VESVIDGKVDNAYCLVRPPGHHAVRDLGMGFCLFNNVALAAMHAKAYSDKIQRVAIVDYDVHHGNGTQDAFWNDPNVLFISLHQDSNYPIRSGGVEAIGGPGAERSNINIPLHPGSGTQAYKYAFDSVVLPALDKFKPDLVLVSSGFDASFADPLGSMMLTSESYRYFATQLIACAERHCGGRIVFAHEGGYSKDYVPYCGLAVVEALSGARTAVVDPYLYEADLWGYQSLQPHQKALVDSIAALHGLAPASSEGEGLEPFESDVAKAVRHLLETVPAERRQEVLRQAAALL
jgi:acetoin utilization deacetylase AcuC-like enzyme